MKRFLIVLLALALIGGAAVAEPVSPVDFLKQRGYTLYEVDGLEALGISSALFEGENAGTSFCGCLYSEKSQNYAIFGRESDGHLYIAHTGAAHALVDAFSPLLSTASMYGIFVDLCRESGVDLAFWLDSAGFRFGLSEDSDRLNALAASLSEGTPRTSVVGWDDFLKLLTFPAALNWG